MKLQEHCQKANRKDSETLHTTELSQLKAGIGERFILVFAKLNRSLPSRYKLDDQSMVSHWSASVLNN